MAHPETDVFSLDHQFLRFFKTKTEYLNETNEVLVLLLVKICLIDKHRKNRAFPEWNSFSVESTSLEKTTMYHR